jgi:hypothetical protein
LLEVNHISIPSFPWGRRPLGKGAVLPRACALQEWVYLSSEPDVYTLEDFWEEATILRRRLEELAQPWEE